jgi:hypothetical protein
MIKAIFQSTGAEETEYGKKGVLIFTDISYDDIPIANRYVFDSLKSFTKHKPKKGDVFQFEGELDYKGGLQIKRPKKVVKLDLSNLAEGYEYCINKFLKESRVLTKDEARNEKVAYIRMSTLFGEELFRYISLPFRLNSLHWFLTEDGQKLCKDQKNKMEKAQKSIDFEEKHVILEKNKIGEDVLVDRKKQSLMGFMK